MLFHSIIILSYLYLKLKTFLLAIVVGNTNICIQDVFKKSKLVLALDSLERCLGQMKEHQPYLAIWYFGLSLFCITTLGSTLHPFVQITNYSCHWHEPSLFVNHKIKTFKHDPTTNERWPISIIEGKGETPWQPHT